MSTSAIISNHFKGVYFGGNWTSSNLSDQLADVTWQEACTQIDSLNTILALSYHIHYYVHAVLQVLEGGELTSKDALSYDHPKVESEEEWQDLITLIQADGKAFVQAIERIQETAWSSDFVSPTYGTYYRNIHGIIEHTHYHLGQIALLKKLVRQRINE